jgi:hypothetical protein
MTPSPPPSKRLTRLHEALVKAIPRIPNDRASLQAAKSKSLTDLLVYYLSWRARYVAPRAREVSVDPPASADPRWAQHLGAIETFLARVRTGEDLTPWLSLEPHTRGLAPAATKPGAAVDRWADKDFLLNVMGLHHFHLGLTLEPQGHAVRTNEMLFAAVTRESFEVIALVDHQVFEDGADGALTAERGRLWTLIETRRARDMEPGSFYIGGGLGGAGISMSGHPTAIVMAAQAYAKVIRDMDPKLDDPDYVSALYLAGRPPKAPKLSWRFDHLDLCLVDSANAGYFVLRRGPN